MEWVCSRLEEQESISDDHLRASGLWLVRAADPERPTPGPEHLDRRHFWWS